MVNEMDIKACLREVAANLSQAKMQLEDIAQAISESESAAECGELGLAAECVSNEILPDAIFALEVALRLRQMEVEACRP